MHWLALLGAVAIVAAACNGSDDGNEAADDDNVDPTAVLVVGENLTGAAFSQNLQPDQMPVPCDMIVGSQIYSTITRRNTKTNEAEPSLAESFELVDLRTFEFKLRSGLTFQDGTKLDAEAAKAGLDRNRTAPSTLVPQMASIDQVIAGTDGLTVTIKLKTDSVTGVALMLSGREGMIAAASSTNTRPVGAGPFKFVSQSVGNEIVLEKYDGYWNADEVQLAGIRYVNVSGAAGINALIADEIDLTPGSPDVNGPAEDDPDIKIEVAPGADYWKLNFNLAKAPFNNVSFRQAISHAVDKEAVAKALFGDDAEVATQPYPTSFKLQYQPQLASRYPYDPARARDLLAKAGATGATVEGQYTANNATFARFAEAVQAQLKAVGLTVNLTASTNLLQSYFLDKQGNFVVTQGLARPSPVDTIATQFTKGQLANVGNYENARFDAAVAKIRGSLDPTVQAGAYKEALEIVVNEALELPVAYPAVTYPHRVDVVSDDWQIYGICQGLDYSKLAITTSKK